jgi:oligoribonuclease
MARNGTFIWIDLEMTGLFPETDHILEIASIITDGDLNVLDHGPALVIHQPDSILDAMIDRVRELHEPSGLVNEVRASTISVEEAERETLNVIQMHCERHKGILAGNSVWQDAAFMRKYMPRLMKYLHYRIVDVSSVKELVTRWYPNDPNLSFEKKTTHRALQDIEESIAELKHYREHFFKKGGE